MRSALLAVAISLAGLWVGGSSKAAGALAWNDQPGCHERLLQRRHGNPLFPPERRAITPSQLSAAQEQDVQAAQKAQAAFQEILSSIEDAPRFGTWGDARKLREQLDELRARVAGIGGAASNLAPDLDRLRAALAESMRSAVRDNPEALAHLEKAERFFQAGKWRYTTSTTASTDGNELDRLGIWLGWKRRVCDTDNSRQHLP